MSAREPTEAPPPGGAPEIASIARAVRSRLTGSRLAHVESVVATAREIARGGGWPAETVQRAVRAAWAHDAVKQEDPAAWRRRIEDAGEVPDAWSLEHAVELLHAPAAAAWARSRGERDPEVLAAIRHHPTGHPDWGDVGRILYVADFCEPTREFAADIGAGALRERAARGPAGLRSAAREVLRSRLSWLLAEDRPVHPDSWRSWNAWTNAGTGEGS